MPSKNGDCMKEKKITQEDIRIIKKLGRLERSIEEINKTFAKNEIHELIVLLGSKSELFRRNFLAGVARGIGTGIGITIITAIIIYILQKIVRLNIPVIGKYINDIMDIIENTK